jgi:glycosyltransferase involved in cell wall biosynthesis
MTCPPQSRDPPRRVAVVHDWLDTWAGGEQALEQILRIYPEAELFALVDFLPAELRGRIGGRQARTSFLQKIPGSRRRFRSLLPLFPKAIESLDLSGYELVISSSHAVAKGVRTDASQLHVCYCYSPMRYAWDLRDQYLSQVGLDRGLRAAMANRLLDRIAAWDARVSSRVNAFVGISEYIARRIERCYGRAAEVIYPPVDIPGALPGVEREPGLYVTVSRLVPYKRIDVIAAAFRSLPGRQLVIVGEGSERPRIEAAAGPNVRLAGQLGDAERNALLARAQAFVFAADEDFGIAPIEAQAHGTPVIGYRKGGLIETIAGLDDDAPTGVFFDAQTPEAIASAVAEFERVRTRIDVQACRTNAQRFAASRFRSEFSAFVQGAHAAFVAGRQ